MARILRMSTTTVLIVCVMGTGWSGRLFASQPEGSSTSTPVAAVSNDRDAASPDALSSISLAPRERLTLNGEALTAPLVLGSLPRSAVNAAAIQSPSFAGQIYQGQPIPLRTHRNDGSVAAIMVGALASITGAAVLIYANRPDCDRNQFAGGCGYGTKVVGGAVLSGGIVGLFVGALTWR